MSNHEVIEAEAIAEVRQGASARTGPAHDRIRLWDLPTRVFHWSLVAAVTVGVVTGELGGDWMDVHGKAGLTIIGLVTFRVVWGFIGSTHSRFLSFVPTPGKVSAYLKGKWQGVGHNPLGAFSVFALLGLLAVQGATGLFTYDDIAFAGPLNALVDEALAGRLTGLHRQLANVLLGLLALHIVAIFFYVRFKREKLIKPMVTGWKEVPAGGAQSGSKGGPVAFTVALLIALGTVYGVSGVRWSGGPVAAVPEATAATATTVPPDSAKTDAAKAPSGSQTNAAPSW